MLIAIEGLTNAGKTTFGDELFRGLQRDSIEAVQINHQVDQDPISRTLKTITSPVTPGVEIDPKTELLLYSAHLSVKANAVLETDFNSLNRFVIVDRFFLSVLCFFTTVRSLDRQLVMDAALIGSRNITPHVTVFIDASIDTIKSRASRSPFTRKDMGIETYWKDLRSSYLTELRQGKAGRSIVIEEGRSVTSAVQDFLSYIRSDAFS